MIATKRVIKRAEVHSRRVDGRDQSRGADVADTGQLRRANARAGPRFIVGGRGDAMRQSNDRFTSLRRRSRAKNAPLWPLVSCARFVRSAPRIFRVPRARTARSFCARLNSAEERQKGRHPMHNGGLHCSVDSTVVLRDDSSKLLRKSPRLFEVRSKVRCTLFSFESFDKGRGKKRRVNFLLSNDKCVGREARRESQRGSA